MLEHIACLQNGQDGRKSRTHNLVNETTGIDETKGPSWADPGCSARGNMITVPKPTALTATYKCSYDAWNRLVEVKEQNDNVVAKFEYDGLGRRTKKFINTGEDQTYDHFRHFYYNAGWQIVETRKSASGENTEPQTLRPEYQYVRGQRYIDAPVLRDENKDSDDYCNEANDDERLYYLTDANMNVTTLTDTAGDAVERYIYDPYGKVTILNGASGVDKDGVVTEWSEDTVQASDVGNSILFAGYWRDSDTGLYHVRHRAYHPNLGRWLQRDPIGYADGMSLYEYVSSGPLGRLDPLGQAWWNPLTWGRVGEFTEMLEEWNPRQASMARGQSEASAQQSQEKLQLAKQKEEEIARRLRAEASALREMAVYLAQLAADSAWRADTLRLRLQAEMLGGASEGMAYGARRSTNAATLGITDAIGLTEEDESMANSTSLGLRVSRISSHIFAAATYLATGLTIAQAWAPSAGLATLGGPSSTPIGTTIATAWQTVQNTVYAVVVGGSVVTYRAAERAAVAVSNSESPIVRGGVGFAEGLAPGPPPPFQSPAHGFGVVLGGAAEDIWSFAGGVYDRIATAFEGSSGVGSSGD